MKKTVSTGDSVYPTWKKVAWRYARVFISVFLVTFALEFSVYGEPTWTGLRALLLSAIVASVSATGKYMREQSDDFDSLVHKVSL